MCIFVYTYVFTMYTHVYIPFVNAYIYIHIYSCAHTVQTMFWT